MISTIFRLSNIDGYGNEVPVGVRAGHTQAEYLERFEQFESALGQLVNRLLTDRGTEFNLITQGYEHSKTAAFHPEEIHA